MYVYKTKTMSRSDSPLPVRSRCRGAGTSNQHRRCGCPWTLPECCWPLPSTRCASRADPVVEDTHTSRLICNYRSNQRDSHRWSICCDLNTDLSPRRLPGGLSRLGRLPQREVVLTLFLAQAVGADAEVTFTFAQRLLIADRFRYELGVEVTLAVVERRRAEIHRAV